MFDNNVKDSIDKKISLLREVRELYNRDRKLYHKIKSLPMKSRVMRDTGKHCGKSVIFVSSNVKTEFYLATQTGIEIIDFLEAVKYLKARPEEQPSQFTNEKQHYKHVNSALAQYTTDYVEAADTSSINRTDLDKTSLEANKFLRTIKQITTDCELKSKCDVLMGYINEGIYAQLPRYLKALSREYKNDRSKMKQDEYSLQNKISELLGSIRRWTKNNAMMPKIFLILKSLYQNHLSKYFYGSYIYTGYFEKTIPIIFQSDSVVHFPTIFFNATELKEGPEKIIGSTSDNGYYLGNIDTTDSYRIGLFHYNITKGSVANRRVGLRNLVKSFINPAWGEFDAALVVFDSGDHWRLSFICDIKGEATSPKRYTYVFGSDDLLYRTPIERFNFLKKKGISFENLKTAFSVEALSDEFFDRYREQYADFIQYITGKRFVKVGSKWEEKRLSEPNAALMGAFDYNEKKIRDYVKKMMGRITFLHFLQRKGWMCGDLNYMQNMFENSLYKNDYLDSVLEPLFFGILNTKPAEREALFTDYDWDKSLLNEWKDIPYLNGGLFERDKEDEPESRFPADYFKRLFQFFSEYNFTIDENDPNDAEVGVDPEMLGKIFENLLEDNKDKGAFYTPKEIVRYMCQESLIAYLETNTSIAKDKIRQFVLSPEEGVKDIPENKKPKLLSALENVKICDPAIGSGAFPMGLLNELLHCREVLSGDHYDRAEIKRALSKTISMV